MNRFKAAFTLIELLIVIAIIAILALIAVPNFLEAQVRAKVARSMADMQAMATAIEAYSVDWGRPPTCYFEWVQAPNCLNTAKPGGDLNALAQTALTTPIAYMSTIKYDFFLERGSVRTTGAKGKYEPIKLYTYMCPYWINLRPDTYGKAAELGYIWQVRSFGPSRTLYATEWPPKVLVGYVDAHVYDASNGTISQGHIVRTNKGHFQGRPGS